MDQPAEKKAILRGAESALKQEPIIIMLLLVMAALIGGLEYLHHEEWKQTQAILAPVIEQCVQRP